MIAQTEAVKRKMENPREQEGSKKEDRAALETRLLVCDVGGGAGEQRSCFKSVKRPLLVAYPCVTLPSALRHPSRGNDH
jgi:hypothetical protein